MESKMNWELVEYIFRKRYIDTIFIEAELISQKELEYYILIFKYVCLITFFILFFQVGKTKYFEIFYIHTVIQFRK